ncbi:hypothetical protein Tco_1378001 [Tanacetum coccineum]
MAINPPINIPHSPHPRSGGEGEIGEKGVGLYSRLKDEWFRMRAKRDTIRGKWTLDIKRRALEQSVRREEMRWYGDVDEMIDEEMRERVEGGGRRTSLGVHRTLTNGIRLRFNRLLLRPTISKGSTTNEACHQDESIQRNGNGSSRWTLFQVGHMGLYYELCSSNLSNLLLHSLERSGNSSVDTMRLDPLLDLDDFLSGL